MDYLQVAALLREKNNILLITHRRPDGDTIGSAAALCHALRDLGKTAYLHHNEDAMGLFNTYTDGLEAEDDFSPQFVVAIDTASWELIPDSAQLRYEGKIDLCIDHHGSNDFFAAETCVDADCAACGELVYYIIKELVPLRPQIALLLYLAISTDTGCFVFSNTTAETHRITAELMACDFDYRLLNKLHFRTKSLRRFYIEGNLVQNMEVLHQGSTVVACLPLSMIQAIGATEEDLDNIASFLEQIDGVEAAITIRELRPGSCKISLRTGTKLNASDICAKLGGGGHPSAAGCSIDGDLDFAKQEIIKATEEYQRGLV